MSLEIASLSSFCAHNPSREYTHIHRQMTPCTRWSSITLATSSHLRAIVSPFPLSQGSSLFPPLYHVSSPGFTPYGTSIRGFPQGFPVTSPHIFRYETSRHLGEFQGHRRPHSQANSSCASKATEEKGFQQVHLTGSGVLGGCAHLFTYSTNIYVMLVRQWR